MSTAIDNDLVCTGCGYNLRGLGLAGRCPECGKSYGPDELVLWGERGAWWDGPWRKRFVRLALTGLFAAYLLWKLIQQGIVHRHVEVVVEVAFWGVVWWTWIRMRGRRWQVIISGRGYTVRQGYGRARLIHWTGEEEIDLRRSERDVYHLTIRRGLSLAVQVFLEIKDSEVQGVRGQMTGLIGRRVGLEM